MQLKALGIRMLSTLRIKKKLSSVLLEIVKSDDIVITLGAGDVWKYGEKIY